MNNATIMHFACHGTQHPTNALHSALHLKDGPLTLLQLKNVKRCHPGSLAFLSACETAKGDSNQPDESIHIAAGMLVAGFQGVVGTMW